MVELKSAVEDLYRYFMMYLNDSVYGSWGFEFHVSMQQEKNIRVTG